MESLGKKAHAKKHAIDSILGGMLSYHYEDHLCSIWMSDLFFREGAAREACVEGGGGRDERLPFSV